MIKNKKENKFGIISFILGIISTVNLLLVFIGIFWV